MVWLLWLSFNRQWLWETPSDFSYNNFLSIGHIVALGIALKVKNWAEIGICDVYSENVKYATPTASLSSDTLITYLLTDLGAQIFRTAVPRWSFGSPFCSLSGISLFCKYEWSIFERLLRMSCWLSDQQVFYERSSSMLFLATFKTTSLLEIISASEWLL